MALAPSFVKALIKGNVASAASQFDKEIRARIAEALQTKRIEVAKTLIVPKSKKG
jgi:hypothetical protein